MSRQRQRQTRTLEQGDMWAEAPAFQCPELVPTKAGPRLCTKPATRYRRDARLYFCPEHATADLTIPLRRYNPEVDA